MCVQMRSRNQRSCEITSALPANSSSALRARAAFPVEVVRGFVQQQHVAARASVLARCRRLRSPPESWPTSFCWSLPVEVEAAEVGAARASRTGRRRCCRARPRRLPTPSCRSPGSVAALVDEGELGGLADAPRPNRAARGLEHAEQRRLAGAVRADDADDRAGGTLKLRLSISSRSPKLLLTFLNSMTSLPGARPPG